MNASHTIHSITTTLYIYVDAQRIMRCPHEGTNGKRNRGNAQGTLKFIDMENMLVQCCVG